MARGNVGRICRGPVRRWSELRHTWLGRRDQTARGTCPDGDRERGAIEIEPAHGVTSSSGRSTELEWVMGGRMHALAAARRSNRIGTRGQHVCVRCRARIGLASGAPESKTPLPWRGNGASASESRMAGCPNLPDGFRHHGDCHTRAAHRLQEKPNARQCGVLSQVTRHPPTHKAPA